MHRFFRVQLRTTDVDRARRFYQAALDEAADFIVVALHEQALARGARPHWLGLIDVQDVDQALAGLVARGAVALGPRWTDPQGMECLTLRDPGGAVLGLARRQEQSAPERSFERVAWSALSTANLECALETYRDSFGWSFAPSIEVDGRIEAHPFSWRAGGEQVGSISSLEGRPEVHPHWLFHFRVPRLGPALERVRAAGGVTLAPVTLPNGHYVAACDDAQGAAFALYADEA